MEGKWVCLGSREDRDLYLGKRGVHVRVLPPPEIKEGELALNVPENQGNYGDFIIAREKL